MRAHEPGSFAPVRRFLVPTDFSRGSELALGRALLIPRAESATIHVVHVLPLRIPAKTRTRAVADATRQLQGLVSKARQRARRSSLEVTSEILFGEPFVEIIRCSRRTRAELIVIGRHGRRQIRDSVIGTTTARVVRKGDVPVLAVGLKPARRYARPMIATDLQDTGVRVFDLALRVLGPGTTSVHVVHAFHVPFEGLVTPTSSGKERSEYRRSLGEEARADMARLLARYEATGVRWKTTIRAGDARSLILAEVARLRSDLIALGTHGRSGVARTLVGSVAEWVISRASCDVLVTRPVRFAFELP